ncbi:MAG TPA: hypothetical protein VNN10_01260 [Dehalococcoidia bacterium]|nr:hypothetical protein [Dehalococcoidia bacterium]
MRGTVSRVILQGRFGFLNAEDGREYYFQEGALEEVALDELAPGTAVSFAPAESSPAEAANPTATNVRLEPSAAEEAPAQNDRGGSLEHGPPPEVEAHEVNEASWESFPASDPPARRQIT